MTISTGTPDTPQDILPPWYSQLDEGEVADAPPPWDAPPQPDLMSDEVVKKVTAGERPAISPAPDLDLVLPRGYTAPDGAVHQGVEVRELTGRDEEYLTRFKTDDAIFDAIISLGVTRLGDLDLSKEPVSAKARILRSLLVAERLMIYLRIITATFGNEKEMRFSCGSCEEEQDVTVLVDQDFPITFPDDLSMHHKVVLPSGKEILYRLITGADTLALAEKTNLSRAEGNSLMLTQIIVNIDGNVPFDVESAVKDLSIGDRERILTHVVEHQPDLTLSLTTECISCHEEVVIPILWGQLFRA